MVLFVDVLIQLQNQVRRVSPNMNAFVRLPSGGGQVCENSRRRFLRLLQKLQTLPRPNEIPARYACRNLSKEIEVVQNLVLSWLVGVLPPCRAQGLPEIHFYKMKLSAK